MTFRAIRRVAVPLLLIAGATACSKGTPPGQDAAASNEILIGEVGSLTGSEATFGTSTRDAIELALREINATGGVKGKKIRVIVIDDEGKAEEAATAVTRLATQDKVVAIIGEEASTRTLAMAPLAQSYKIPLVTPSSVNPEITKKGDYIFRVCFVDSFQGMVMARFAAQSLHARSAAILRDVKNDYSVGMARVFVENFTRLGGKIVEEQSYGAGDSDFKSQLTSIKAKAPDVIYLPGYYTDVGLVARQKAELGLAAPLLGGDAWDSPKLIEIGGPALNGSFFSNHYSPDDTSPLVQNFIKNYAAAFGGGVPDSLAATGYDAMKVVADALRRAKGDSPADLRDALAATRNFPGVSGTITIDKDRNATKTAVVVEVRNGRLAFKESVKP